MVATLLNRIEPFIYFEGCTFQLTFVVTQFNNATLAYALTNVFEHSKHHAHYKQLDKWLPPGSIMFVKTFGQVGGIKNETDLRLGIHELVNYLKKHGIDAEKKPGKRSNNRAGVFVRP